MGVWKPNLPDRYLRNSSILFPIANTKSRPVDSRVCFLYARFIYKTKRLIAPQHNRLIVFNSSFSKLYRDVGIFSGQSNIPCMGIRCIAWCLEGCVTSFLLLVNPFVIWHWNVLYDALKSILWHGRNWFEKKCLWLHSSDINVWWANCSSCMAIMAIRISSEFWSMTLRRFAKTFLQTESTGRDPDNLLRWIISHFLSNVFAGVPNENKIRRKGCTQRSR